MKPAILTQNNNRVDDNVRKNQKKDGADAQETELKENQLSSSGDMELSEGYLNPSYSWESKNIYSNNYNKVVIKS